MSKKLQEHNANAQSKIDLERKFSSESQKILRMVIKMISKKSSNKKVTVVVARLHSQSQGMTGGFASSS